MTYINKPYKLSGESPTTPTMTDKIYIGRNAEEIESPKMPSKKEFKINLIIKKILRGKPCR